MLLAVHYIAVIKLS